LRVGIAIRKQTGSCLSVIFATQEAKIRKIKVQSQPGQIVCEILSLKIPITKTGLLE
jgi:hypothetical protein